MAKSAVQFAVHWGREVEAFLTPLELCTSINHLAQLVYPGDIVLSTETLMVIFPLFFLTTTDSILKNFYDRNSCIFWAALSASNKLLGTFKKKKNHVMWIFEVVLLWGYISFLPLKEETFERILRPNFKELRDITSDTIVPYQKVQFLYTSFEFSLFCSWVNTSSFSLL